MLLYYNALKDDIDRLIRMSNRLRTQFYPSTTHSEKESPDEWYKECNLILMDHLQDLKDDARTLRELVENFLPLLPRGVRAGEITRNLYWLEKHLDDDNPMQCQMIIDEICHRDMPIISHSFLDWCSSIDHYDDELASAVSDLLRRKQWDSAVRKGFAILKTRFVTKYNLPDHLDGHRLVARLFGTDGPLNTLDENEKQALRGLLSGLYTLFRNNVAHNAGDIEWYEVEAALSMINWLLKHEGS